MALDTDLRPRSVGRTLLPLAAVFLAVGISTAMVGPFLSLFLSTAVHAGPLEVTAFLIATPLAGVVSSTLVGRASDRWPIRRAIMIAASLSGLIGTGLAAFVREYAVLLAVSVTLFAFAGALYPQTFAYARQVLSRDDPDRSAMAISALRTVFSLAWVAGPPLAALLLSIGGFRLLYAAASATYVVSGLVAIFLLKEQPASAPAVEPPSHLVPLSDLVPPPDPVPPPSSVPSESDVVAEPAVRPGPEPTRLVLWLTVVAFVLLQCPLALGVQALPLYVSRDLGGKVADAGLILGFCAFLEIPLMLGLGWLTTRIRLRSLVVAGACCGVAYELLAVLATGVPLLVGAQIVNALFIAAVNGLGITYMQDMLPGRPGRATTLFTNSFPIGAVLGGPIFGLAQEFGFRWAYVTNVVLCVGGLALLLAARPSTPVPQAQLLPVSAQPAA
jgi:SET family sugar efflux transporter-like MFS transporter